jgi:hypothetical protein
MRKKEFLTFLSSRLRPCRKNRRSAFVNWTRPRT